MIFANVTEEDIRKCELREQALTAVLRRDWDALAKAHPDRLTIKYTLDKPPKGWKGTCTTS